MNSLIKKPFFRILNLLFSVFMPIVLFGQNENVFTGDNFSTYYIFTNESQSGATDLISNGSGSGSFSGGTYTYTIDQDFNFILNESFGEENHKYIGSTSPSGEYAVLIPDPATEDYPGISGYMKLSDSKTNADFSGSFITSYYRFDASDDLFAGLFEVTADGVDSCTYHQLMGTESTRDEEFKYAVDAEGRIILYNNVGVPVIGASINESSDCYIYSSIEDGFPAIGYGVEKNTIFTGADVAGDYNLMQIRYDKSYGEQSVSLLSFHLDEDGTGTYRIDTNTHGEKTSGTVAISYVNNGYWSIVLDGDSDYTIYGAINPTEKLITGYFNYGGDSPGIVFGIEKYVPATTNAVSGSVSKSVEIYPNPVFSILSIEVEDLLSAELIDVKGAVQRTVNGSSENLVQIDASSLNSGLYLLRLTTIQGVIMKKVIIQ